MRAAGRPGGRGWRRLPPGWCERVGEDSPLLWKKGAARLFGARVGLGCPCRIGGDVSVAVVSVNKKASKIASPPLRVRMCVGPCG